MLVKKLLTKIITSIVIIIGFTTATEGCSYKTIPESTAEKDFVPKKGTYSERNDGMKPNVVYILVDQLREASLPWNDINVTAPNLERLAKEGVTLTQTFSTNPICCPARASMITGLYPQSHGVIINDLQLRTDVVSIAHVYGENGYETGYVGKWHLDGAKKVNKTEPGFVPPGPRRQGFDYWAGVNAWHKYWESKYYDKDGTLVSEKGYQPDFETDRAIGFIKENKDKPFYLFLSWGPPHGPYSPTGVFDERWQNLNFNNITLRPNVPAELESNAKRNITNYNVHISALDKNLGRIMDTLDEYGITENTILVFTSDHGDMLYSHGKQQKSQPEDEAIHIPFIIRYPEVLGKGQKNSAMFSTVDFMPTLLSLSGLPIPEAVQGRNLSDVIINNKPELGPESVYLQGAIGRAYEWRTIRTQQYMLAMSLQQTDKAFAVTHLFDMKKDPYQMNNLTGNLQYKEIERELKDKLIQWAMDTKDESFLELVGEDTGTNSGN